MSTRYLKILEKLLCTGCEKVGGSCVKVWQLIVDCAWILTYQEVDEELWLMEWVN